MMTNLQRKVVDAARRELQQHGNYRGVCLDDLPKDKEILADFQACVDTVVMNTEMWMGYPSLKG